jgi:hypothetical protein
MEVLPSHKQDAVLQEYVTLIWSHANVLFSIQFDEDNYQSIITRNVYIIEYNNDGIVNILAFPYRKICTEIIFVVFGSYLH